MRSSKLWIPVTLLTVAGHLPGCGAPTPRHYPRQIAGGISDAGKTEATGGAPEPEPGTGGAAAGGSTGGRGGEATGGSPGTGGASSTGGVSGDDLPDAAETGGAGGSLQPDAAPTPDLPGTGGAMGGRDGSAGTGGQGGRDAGPLPGNGTTAACHPDPNVIAICKQLEPACQNCANGTVNRCYDVAAAGDDRACVRYAVDNDCKVDVGGNWCGSLNCMASGCDRSMCRTLQGEGASAACQKLLDQCPCR